MDAAQLPGGLAERYRIERPIAGGAFGWVFEATQLGLNRRVALKVLHGEKLTDASHVKRFRAEAKLTAALAHPHIVTILDHDVADGVPWIAYELLTEGTLDDQLRHGPMKWPLALMAAAQVAAALDCAHTAGVLHRDIKGKNVMVAGHDMWKVADFGLAKYSSDTTVLTQAGALIGSPVYMSPELCRGEAASPASDLYALGILLYEMLVGEWPFTAPTPLAVLRKQVNDPPPRPSERRRGLPGALDEIVLRLLAKDARERPQSAAEVREELEGLMPAESRSRMALYREASAQALSRSTSDPQIAPGRGRPSGGMRAFDDAQPSRSKSNPAMRLRHVLAGSRTVRALACLTGALVVAAAAGHVINSRRRAQGVVAGTPQPVAASAAPAAQPHKPLTPPTRAKLLAVRTQVTAEWDAEPRSFGEFFEGAADLDSFMGLSPAEAAQERLDVAGFRDRCLKRRERIGAVLAEARAELGELARATAEDLVPIAAATKVHVASLLEGTRCDALVKVLEKMHRGKDKAGITDVLRDLDTGVCYPPGVIAEMETYGDLLGIICSRAAQAPERATARWPASLHDFLWLGSYFENFQVCGGNRADVAHRVLSRVTGPLARVDNPHAPALRQLVEDVWYFGAQVDAPTTVRRAQRALQGMERFEALQPQCTADWRELARLTDYELKRMGTARLKSERNAKHR